MPRVSPQTPAPVRLPAPDDARTSPRPRAELASCLALVSRPMMNRLRLFQLVALMLYAGPLFAGLAGYGWGMVWPFTAIFLLWQVVMRPAEWPRDLTAWANPALPMAAVAKVAILAILVALCFGVGRGLGGAVGFLPAIPAAAPLALSLVAIPLARLLWDPVRAAEIDALVDQATRDINALAGHTSADARHLAAADALAGRLLEPLAQLPDGTSDDTILAHLRAIGRQVDDAPLRRALMAATAQGPDMPMVLQRALMLHASDGRLMEILVDDNAAQAFIALPDSAALFETFAHRLAFALQEDPDVWWGMPSTETILGRADRLRGTAAEAALRDLAALNDRVAPPEDAPPR